MSISHRHLGSDVLERIIYGIMQERHKRSMNMTTTEFKPSNVDQPLRVFMNNGDRCTCLYCTGAREAIRATHGPPPHERARQVSLTRLNQAPPPTLYKR